MTRDEMLDKREDVLDEFDDRVDPSHGVMTLGEQRWFTAQLLADEIVRLRAILAAVEAERDALREAEREREQQWKQAMDRLMPDDVDQVRRQEEWEIIRSFGLKHDDGTSIAEHAMAREIRQLRRILAALREPSKAVLDAAYVRLYPGCFPEERTEFTTPEIRDAIRAAVAAAEKEAGA